MNSKSVGILVTLLRQHVATGAFIAATKKGAVKWSILMSRKIMNPRVVANFRWGRSKPDEKDKRCGSVNDKQCGSTFEGF
jgi:hypothetical protein